MFGGWPLLSRQWLRPLLSPFLPANGLMEESLTTGKGKSKFTQLQDGAMYSKGVQ